MSHFRIRSDRFPIVDIEIKATATTEDVEDIFRGYAAVVPRGQRAALIIDLRNVTSVGVSAADRKRAAGLFDAHAASMVSITACEARIVSHALTRGVLTAIDWLTGTKWPCATFTSPADADAWVARQMAGKTRDVSSPASV